MTPATTRFDPTKQDTKAHVFKETDCRKGNLSANGTNSIDGDKDVELVIRGKHGNTIPLESPTTQCGNSVKEYTSGTIISMVTKNAIVAQINSVDEEVNLKKDGKDLDKESIT